MKAQTSEEMTQIVICHRIDSSEAINTTTEVTTAAIAIHKAKKCQSKYLNDTKCNPYADPLPKNNYSSFPLKIGELFHINHNNILSH